MPTIEVFQAGTGGDGHDFKEMFSSFLPNVPGAAG
jgi:hypothetical protein